MSFPSIDSPYRTSNASTTYMHTCLLRVTMSSYFGRARKSVKPSSYARASLLSPALGREACNAVYNCPVTSSKTLPAPRAIPIHMSSSTYQNEAVTSKTFSKPSLHSL